MNALQHNRSVPDMNHGLGVMNGDLWSMLCFQDSLGLLGVRQILFHDHSKPNTDPLYKHFYGMEINPTSCCLSILFARLIVGQCAAWRNCLNFQLDNN